MKPTQVESSWLRAVELPFHRHTLDLAERVHATGQWVLTDFLTPREWYILKSVAENQGLVLGTFGGYANAERVRALLMPDDWYPQDEDFQVAVLEVAVGQDTSMTHGEVMGSVLGTGVRRQKLGDIIVDASRAFVLVTRDIVPYLMGHLQQVGRRGASVSLVEQATVSWSEPIYVRDLITVAAPRADAVIAHACHLSRAAAQTAIERGHVSLNFTVLEHLDESVEPGDILSVRGFGRVKVYEILGQTKKDKYRLEVGVLKSGRA